MQLNIQQIKKILPHRYPFLLVDKVLKIDYPSRSITAQKNVTVNEEFFNGHFPDQSIMPGVLIIEAMAQVTGILGVKIMNSAGTEVDDKKLFVLAGVDKVRLKKPVVPGDTLIFEATMNKIKQGMCKSSVETFVDNVIVASAQFLAAYKEIQT
jgi:beta-hydroxyacyl-ACP dehydratase FabZ